jgi:Protein of unknown function (DUF3306)
MTFPESFVSRWARLKRGSDIQRGTEVAAERGGASVAETPATGVEGAIARPEIAAAADAPFDPASLPSIDAIGIDTDIRGFLQSRVPAELTRAALRQAWASDPAIRDFIGIAENQWDFNGPNAISGFGPLPEGYDVSELLSQALGGRNKLTATFPEMSETAERLPSAVTDREPADPGFDVPQSADAEFGSLPDDRSGERAAPESDQVAESNDRPPNPRRHGSALPRHDG